MANEMPKSTDFTGLTQKVIAYSEEFAGIVEKAKSGPLEASDWAGIEALVNVDAYERMGVFLGPQAEVIDWPKYKYYVSQYAAGSSWEGTLRHVTEQANRVILELEERNSRDGVTDVSNTVTIYEFDDAQKLRHLDVYVMPLGKR
ncbi:hypothetical protein EDF56_101769 [Novosphingobium sp. PhB165]|uniref:hypothetical protein n=1 Tax=Novosphingobium sp. PhB165 TaxID=2485105 RepID=UPI0010481B19|nr:hypothetical protein [Novosphingobium sp. PhB165]TCM22088.1 hypothetical protein EDF56_101769 [Novosphingobium sp. PhB165]